MSRPQGGRPRFLLGGSVGRGRANAAADVSALKERLIALGYDWIPRSSTFDSETALAVQLFQSIIAGSNVLSGDGHVDVPGQTYSWLQARNAPRWQLMPAGSPEEGFHNAELADRKDQHDYGTSWLADTIRAAAAAYRDGYRKTHPRAALLTVNDASLPRGGRTRDHDGHQTGMACDLRLPRKDGTAPGGITWEDPVRWKAKVLADMRPRIGPPVAPERIAAIEDWLKRYEAREIWALRRSGPEPPPPGAPPAELAAYGTPPGAFRRLGTYHIQVPGHVDTIKLTDRHVAPTYPYLLHEEGVNHEGTPVKDLPAGVLDQILAEARSKATLSDTEVKVLKRVSLQEGGFEAVNAYDTGYVSFGFIQFTTGKDGNYNLYHLLTRIKKEYPARFASLFHDRGIDVGRRSIAVLDLATGAELQGADAVMKIIRDPRLAAVLYAAGLDLQVRAAQIIQAKASYYQPLYTQRRLTFKVKAGKSQEQVTLSGAYADALRSDAGKIAFVDRAVQKGPGDADKRMKEAARQACERHGLKGAITFADLAPHEREIIPSLINRIQVLTRPEPGISQPQCWG